MALRTVAGPSDRLRPFVAGNLTPAREPVTEQVAETTTPLAHLGAVAARDEVPRPEQERGAVVEPVNGGMVSAGQDTARDVVRERVVGLHSGLALPGRLPVDEAQLRRVCAPQREPV